MMDTIRNKPVLAIILVSYLMIVLDVSIVITGLPKIRDELGLSSTSLSWVQSAYTLAFGGFLLLGARAGDILGRRRMFLAGLGLFTLTSVFIGFAQTPAWLLASRAVQGLGAAILAPSTLALLTTNFDEGPERIRAIGYYGAVAGIGGSLGLVLGGLLADLISWRAGFFINLPLGLVLMAAARRHLKETPRHAGQFDLAGALASTFGMTIFVYGVVRAAATGWTDRTTLSALAAGLVLLAVFVLNEWRAAQPIMPLRLFHNRERNGAYAARALFLGAMIGFWFFVSQFLQGVLGYSAFEAGLAFLPATLTNFGAALMVPKLSHRFGHWRVLPAALAIALLGMAWLSLANAGSSYPLDVALPMILIGVGQGGALSTLTVAGVSGVAAEDAGAASGIVNVAHQLGNSLGLSVLVVVFAAGGAGAEEARVQLAQRVAAALTGSSVMLALALLVVYMFILRPCMVRESLGT